MEYVRLLTLYHKSVALISNPKKTFQSKKLSIRAVHVTVACSDSQLKEGSPPPSFHSRPVSTFAATTFDCIFESPRTGSEFRISEQADTIFVRGIPLLDMVDHYCFSHQSENSADLRNAMSLTPLNPWQGRGYVLFN